LLNINHKWKGKEKALPVQESEEESLPPDPRDFDVNYSVSYSSNGPILASSSKTILPPFLERNFSTMSKTYPSERSSYDAHKGASLSHDRKYRSYS
jgi:hypothetical protein